MTPCKSCTSRRVGCHAECERYLAFYAENEERRKAREMQIAVRDLLAKRKIRSERYNRRCMKGR